MNEDEVEEYILEHWGIKGQKWGIRNKKKGSGSGGSSKSGSSKPKGFSRDGSMSRSEKVATIAAGGVVAALLLRKFGGMLVV